MLTNMAHIIFQISQQLSKKNRNKIRLVLRSNSSTKIENVNLVGKDITNPEFIASLELKALLWTAADMKVMRNSSSLLQSKHVTLLFSHSCLRHQIGFERAARNLGAGLSCFIDSHWVNQPDICSGGRTISSMSDVIVVKGFNQINVQNIADGSTSPVLSISSDHFAIVEAITNLLTLQEALGCLRRRSIAWVGPPNALCNTLIYFAPKLGFNLRVFCPDGSQLLSSPTVQHAFSLCQGKSDLHECTSVEEATYRTDATLTTMHDFPQHCVTEKILEEASLDWYFLHSLPRSNSEVSDGVFKHKNNLTWKSLENTRFVAMALLLSIFKKHSFTTPIPDFEGNS